MTAGPKGSSFEPNHRRRRPLSRRYSAVKSDLSRGAPLQISAEIRAAQQEQPGNERRYRGTLAVVGLPRPLRSLGWRAVMRNPRWSKRFGGTVGLSAVGMFGTGGGWGIVAAPPTLMVVVGGISTQPRLIDGQLQDRQFLHVTLSFDHDVVDGGSAARFAARLAELVESADGLPAVA